MDPYFAPERKEGAVGSYEPRLRPRRVSVSVNPGTIDKNGTGNFARNSLDCADLAHGRWRPAAPML